MTSVVTRWWLIRHAPVIGAEGRLYGQDDLDCDCSDRGLFNDLATLLPKEAVWLVTPLRRTRATADAIQAARGDTPVYEIEPDFAEQHFGDWQGLTYAELEARGDEAYRRFWQAPADLAPPRGESFKDVIARVDRALDRRTALHHGRDIVAVIHGGAIRATLAVALDLEPERALGFAIDPCSITHLDRIDGPAVRPGDGGSWRIVTVNRPPRHSAS